MKIVRLEAKTGESWRVASHSGNAAKIEVDIDDETATVYLKRAGARSSGDITIAEVVTVPWHNVKLIVEEPNHEDAVTLGLKLAGS